MLIKDDEIVILNTYGTNLISGQICNITDHYIDDVFGELIRIKEYPYCGLNISRFSTIKQIRKMKLNKLYE